MNAQHCWKMIHFRPESNACVLLEKRKLIKKLIFSFSHVSVFSTQVPCMLWSTASVCDIGRGHSPHTFVPFIYNAFCLETLGQDMRRTFFGRSCWLWKGCLDWQSMLSQRQACDLSDKSTPVFLNEWIFLSSPEDMLIDFILCIFFMNLFFDVFLRCRATFSVQLRGRPGKQVPASTVGIFRFIKQEFAHMQKECSKWWNREGTSERAKICRNQLLKNSGL